MAASASVRAASSGSEPAADSMPCPQEPAVARPEATIRRRYSPAATAANRPRYQSPTCASAARHSRDKSKRTRENPPSSTANSAPDRPQLFLRNIRRRRRLAALHSSPVACPGAPERCKIPAREAFPSPARPEAPEMKPRQAEIHPRKARAGIEMSCQRRATVRTNRAPVHHATTRPTKDGTDASRDTAAAARDGAGGNAIKAEDIRRAIDRCAETYVSYDRATMTYIGPPGGQTVLPVTTRLARTKVRRSTASGRRARRGTAVHRRCRSLPAFALWLLLATGSARSTTRPGDR